MLKQFRTPDGRKLWLDLSQALEVRETGNEGRYLAVFPMDYNHAYTIREFVGTEEDVKTSIETRILPPENPMGSAVEPTPEFIAGMSRMQHFTFRDI